MFGILIDDVNKNFHKIDTLMKEDADLYNNIPNPNVNVLFNNIFTPTYIDYIVQILLGYCLVSI